jgi:hypothetical protein
VAEHRIALAVPPAAALAAVGRAAAAWGAEWAPDGGGGSLRLPVIAGLRRGLVSGRLEAQPAGEGSAVAFTPESADHFLHAASVAILLFAVAGALLTVLWPFVPSFMPVAPFGAILALGGWFLVVSRLHTSGPDEFLKAVEIEAAGG